MEHCVTTVDRQPHPSDCYVSFRWSNKQPHDLGDPNYNFLLFQPVVHILPGKLPNRHQLFQPKIPGSEANSNSTCWRIVSKLLAFNRVLHFLVCSLSISRHVERREGKSPVQTKRR